MLDLGLLWGCRGKARCRVLLLCAGAEPWKSCRGREAVRLLLKDWLLLEVCSCIVSQLCGLWGLCRG